MYGYIKYLISLQAQKTKNRNIKTNFFLIIFFSDFHLPHLIYHLKWHLYGLPVEFTRVGSFNFKVLRGHRTKQILKSVFMIFTKIYWLNLKKNESHALRNKKTHQSSLKKFLNITIPSISLEAACFKCMHFFPKPCVRLLIRDS